jgi:integrase
MTNPTGDSIEIISSRCYLFRVTSWRPAWHSLRKSANLPAVRFHDGRHTALTRLAEAGQPDWVIQAQLGHGSPAMMKTYSHIRRKALDEAAAALEAPDLREWERKPIPKPTSQFTSQSDPVDAEIEEILSFLSDR